ncbi:hypothetical protein ACFSQJ_05705 [Croceitalea marina]|uniref:TonB-dependent receptor n=1 Tax=Croceitalea marina TaxID=1775166 RepID=A0ABW5MVL6_9FLAO
MTKKSIKKINLYIFLFVGFGIGHAQLLKGTVLDTLGDPIPSKILIKTSKDSKVIREFILSPKGKFSYTLKKSYDLKGLFLEVVATGYTSYEAYTKPTDLKDELQFNFTLIKEKIHQLNEVIVESKKPFTIKKDTVVYNVDSYADGTEKKVEDLLKKLPGIEINDANGVIKYRGKSIETVTLEGDNLFDYNYSIGTKNINIDLVKEIEAIENYSENKLLKGIESSDKVILNLKLKDNKSDISGTANLGLGYADDDTVPVDSSLDILGINKKYKSFAVAAFNTIGENVSPFDYYSNSITIEGIKDRDYYTEVIIPEFAVSQLTNNNLSNINNQFFGNLNTIFQLSKKMKAKVNFYYLDDDLNSNQFLESRINTLENQFTTFDNNFITKKPTQYRGDAELKYNLSKSSLLEYDISYRDETINTSRIILSNQENDFKSNLSSRNQLLKQNLQYTKKVSSTKAVQVNILNTVNNLNQDFDIDPSVFNDADNVLDEQNITSNKYNSNLNAILLGKRPSNDNYSVLFGVNRTKDGFNSFLSNQNNAQELIAAISNNNFEFIKNEIYNQGTYNWRLGKLVIAPKYSLTYLSQDLEQNTTNLTSKNLIFEPSLSLSYKVDKTSLLTVYGGFNRNTQATNRFFSNQILINNRIVTNNTPDITLQRSQNYGLSFSKNDLYNQFELSFGGQYLAQKGNFFTNAVITENTTRLTSFFLPERTENIDFYLVLSKLVPFIKTNVKVTSNYGIFNFKNIINNSSLVDNKSTFMSNSLLVKTAFNSMFNFNNTTKLVIQKNKGQSVFSNNLLQNKFELTITPSKQLSGAVTYDYFIPSIEDNTNNYSFLSTKLVFKPKNKNWEVGFSGVNLLNENFFFERNIGEISANTFQVNLLDRYYLFNFSFTF